VYIRQGDLTQARAYLERGLAVSSGYPDLHTLLGQVSEREHKLDEAMRHYERALEIQPRNPEALARRNALRGAY
jgi:Tfp pilus assembly protein PilF